jgi:hypothetical protein
MAKIMAAKIMAKNNEKAIINGIERKEKYRKIINESGICNRINEERNNKISRIAGARGIEEQAWRIIAESKRNHHNISEINNESNERKQ